MVKKNIVILLLQSWQICEGTLSRTCPSHPLVLLLQSPEWQNRLARRNRAFLLSDLSILHLTRKSGARRNTCNLPIFSVTILTRTSNTGKSELDPNVSKFSVWVHHPETDVIFFTLSLVCSRAGQNQNITAGPWSNP
ncbi:hypothetical protein BD769DRAFT_623370 [Suillus cothurnatus]|nr:hypothetical protein BD769DRAFT_623370 [Suillus cothurnatus]